LAGELGASDRRVNPVSVTCNAKRGEAARFPWGKSPCLELRVSVRAARCRGKSGLFFRASGTAPGRRGAVVRRMGPRDYRAILSAVDEAIAICDSYGAQLDEARRKIRDELRRVQAELRRELEPPVSETP
jgi:hypothetical protein